MAGDANNLRYLIDSYRDWMAGEGIPIVEGIAVDLNGVTTAPWARLGSGVRGAFVQLRGRGDFVGLHVIDIPPGHNPQANCRARENQGREVQQRDAREKDLTFPGLIAGCGAFLLGLVVTLCLCRWRGW